MKTTTEANIIFHPKLTHSVRWQAQSGTNKDLGTALDSVYDQFTKDFDNFVAVTLNKRSRTDLVKLVEEHLPTTRYH